MRAVLWLSSDNGSYVGDYSTQPPTLQPIVKRSKGYILGIAVPSFIGERKHHNTAQYTGQAVKHSTISRVQTAQTAQHSAQLPTYDFC